MPAATWMTLSPSVSEETAEAVIGWAYEVGINYFDTSEVYSGGRAEALLGSIIRRKGWRRSSYVLSAKVHWGKTSPDGDMRGLSRKTIVESVRGSLDRLGVDYIDVVILHKADPMCPMEGNPFFVSSALRCEGGRKMRDWYFYSLVLWCMHADHGDDLVLGL